MGRKLVLCGWRISCSLQSKAWHNNKTATRACRNMSYWYTKLKRPLPFIHIEVGNLRPNHILDRGHNISLYRKCHPVVFVSNTPEKIPITIIERYLQYLHSYNLVSMDTRYRSRRRQIIPEIPTRVAQYRCLSLEVQGRHKSTCVWWNLYLIPYFILVYMNDIQNTTIILISDIFSQGPDSRKCLKTSPGFLSDKMKNKNIDAWLVFNFSSISSISYIVFHKAYLL